MARLAIESDSMADNADDMDVADIVRRPCMGSDAYGVAMA
jgi:hypothetical protein